MLGLLEDVAVLVVIVSAVAVVRGHAHRAGLHSRRAGGFALVAGLVAVGALGACQPDSTRDHSRHVAAEGGSPSVSPSPPTATAGSASTDPAESVPTPSATPTDPAAPAGEVAAALAAAAPSTALDAVGDLPVKGRAPMTGYSRDEFGQAWADVDRNGCDTRNDILRRDLVDRTMKAGTSGCKVLSGYARPEPYTGSTVHFVYGGADEIDIDHVVALGDAWQTGAQAWTADRRRTLANDPLELLAVSASANRQKGDGDTATWLPANRAYRCPYVARQVAVKRRYGLWVTPAERDAMVRVLGTCPSQPLPTAGAVPLDRSAPVAAAPAPTRTVAPAPKPTRAAPAPPPAATATDPRFGTCKEAKAHGYGPYYRGRDPEYDWYRDADHDGVDCE